MADANCERYRKVVVRSPHDTGAFLVGFSHLQCAIFGNTIGIHREGPRLSLFEDKAAMEFPGRAYGLELEYELNV